MKGYVYVFRQLGTDFYKIGMTTKETVQSRFDSFKTYAPQGAEITHVIKTENAAKLEKAIHSKYAKHRTSGEFFMLTDSLVSEIRNTKDDFQNKLYSLFIQLITKYEINEDNIDSFFGTFLKNGIKSNKNSKFMNILKNMNIEFTTEEFIAEGLKQKVTPANCKVMLSRFIGNEVNRIERGKYQKITF